MIGYSRPKLALFLAFAPLCASFDLPIGVPVAGNTSSGPPFMGYVRNHVVGEDINLSIVDSDSIPSRFKVEVFGAAENGEVYTSLSDGSYTLIIPGSFVGAETLLVITDILGETGGCESKPSHCRPTFRPSPIIVTAHQNSGGVRPGINVYTKDHHLRDPFVYILAMNVVNYSGEPVSNFKVMYFFNKGTSITGDPVIFDHYSPDSSPALKKICGTHHYALELDFDGLTLQPGDSSEDSQENQIWIHYENFQMIDKTNDFSNPIPEKLFYLPESTLYNLNEQVAVFDSSGNIISGLAFQSVDDYQDVSECPE